MDRGKISPAFTLFTVQDKNRMPMLSRRQFLHLSLLAGAAWLAGCSSDDAAQPREAQSSGLALTQPIYWPGDERIAAWLQGAETTYDASFSPQITAPRLAEVATEVQTGVAAPLAAATDHYIQRLILYDPESLVKVKFVATFSPHVLAADVSCPIKMLRSSQLAAIAESNAGRRWWAQSAPIKVDVAGCGAGDAPDFTMPANPLRVRFQGIEAAAGSADRALVRLEARLHHPMTSGLHIDEAGNVTRTSEPFFVQRLVASYGGQPLADFELTPGISENPVFSFVMPRLGNEPVSVAVVNNAGQEFSLNALIAV